MNEQKINQGDKIDYIYFIEDGEVELKQKNEYAQDYSSKNIADNAQKLVQQIEFEQKISLLNTNCRNKYRNSFQQADQFRYIAVLSVGEIFGEDFMEHKVRQYSAICKSVKLILYRIKNLGMKLSVLKTKQNWRNQLKNTAQMVQTQFNPQIKIDRTQHEEYKRKSHQFIHFDAFSEEQNEKNMFNMVSRINSYNQLIVPPNHLQQLQQKEQTQLQQPDNKSSYQINSSRQSFSYHTNNNNNGQSTQPSQQQDNIQVVSNRSIQLNQNQNINRNRQLQASPNYYSMRDLKVNRKSILQKSNLPPQSQENQSSILFLDKDEFENQQQQYQQYQQGSSYNLQQQQQGTVESLPWIQQISQQQQNIDQSYFTGSSQLNKPVRSSHSLSNRNDQQQLQQQSLRNNQKQFDSTNKQFISDRNHYHPNSNSILNSNNNDNVSFKNKISLSILPSFQKKQMNKTSTTTESIHQLETINSFNKLHSEFEFASDHQIVTYNKLKIDLNHSQDNSDLNNINNVYNNNQVKNMNNINELININLKSNDNINYNDNTNSNKNINNQNEATLNNKNNSPSRLYQPQQKISFPNKIQYHNLKKQIISNSHGQSIEDMIEKGGEEVRNSIYHVYKFNDAIKGEEKIKKESIKITNQQYIKRIARKIQQIHSNSPNMNKKLPHFNPFNFTTDKSVPVLKQLKIDEIFPDSPYAMKTKKGLKDINKMMHEDHAQQLEASNIIRIQKKLPTLINDQLSKEKVIQLATTMHSNNINNSNKDHNNKQNNDLHDTQLSSQDSKIYLKILIDKMQQQQQLDDIKNPSYLSYNFVTQNQQNSNKNKFNKSTPLFLSNTPINS